MNFGAEEDMGSVDGDWLGEYGTENGNGNGGAMFWSGWGVNGSLDMVRKTGLEVKVRDVVEDADGGSYLWVLASKR